MLIAQLTGRRRETPAPGTAAAPSDMYAVPNRRHIMYVVGLPLVWETPLRTGNLRDPNGPQVTFASESPSTSSPRRRRRIPWNSGFVC